MLPLIAGAFLLLNVAAALHAESMQISGTLCRTNRAVDRLVLDSGGTRHLVALGRSSRVTLRGGWYEADDLRPGDKVEIFADRDPAGILHPLRVDVTAPAGASLPLLGSRPRLVGRFAVREAKTEFFTLNVPGNDYVRVDAKAAYGPKGRVWVSTLRSGDLLEIGGTWAKKGEIRASSIHVLTDSEPDFCRRHAGTSETEAETSAREKAEQRFLAGHAPEPEPDDESSDASASPAAARPNPRP